MATRSKTKSTNGAKSRPSPQQIALARKGGFSRKAPKKPKASASLSTLENWITRWNEWVKGVHEGVKNAQAQEQAKQKKVKLRATISGL